MADTTISIITPSYNQGKYLEETIKSVINQKYSKVEYLIIDGGSSDNSPEIINKYKSNLSYYVIEKDKGQADAINKGLKKATGDIVSYINSDDLYMPGVLSQIAEYFDKNTDVGMIYGDFSIIDEKSKVLKEIREIKFDYIMGCFIGFGLIIPQPTVFFRRKLIDNIGYFNENFNYSLDSEYWSRLVRVCKVKHISKFIASFRVHKDSKTYIHNKFNTKLYTFEKLYVLERDYKSLFISKIIPFKYSFLIRKGYMLKRVIIKMIKGYYF